MEHYHKCLGIYMAGNSACVVLIGKESDDYEVLDSFAVSVDEQAEAVYANLAAGIAEKCREKKMEFSDVAVALDCTMFSQQNLRSDFNDPKQIAQTIKFDAEEALAVDAVDIAVAFEIIDKVEDGSEVAIFAANRNLVSEIVIALQSNGLDPVTLEPDVICLRRFVARLANSDGENNHTWAGISNRNCYLISSNQKTQKSRVRTFLTSPKQDKNNLLFREMTITFAAAGSDGTEKLQVFDTSGTVNCDQLAGRLAVEVQARDLAALLKRPSTEDQQQNVDPLELVIATGAAVGQLTKTDKVDFRPDFMPYLGKKAVFEKTVKIISISVAALLLALGLYLQMQMFKTNSYRGKLQTKLKNEYSIAMPGQGFPRTENPVSKLKREKKRIENVKAGFLSAGGDDSIPAKLTFLLEALNTTPKDVDLDIGTITVTGKSTSIIGSTSARGHLKLLSSIDKHPKLRRGQTKYERKNNRDNFRITVKLKQ